MSQMPGTPKHGCTRSWIHVRSKESQGMVYGQCDFSNEKGFFFFLHECERLIVQRRGQETTPGSNLVLLPVFVSKFCWNTTSPGHLHIVYGWFQATTVESGSCNRASLYPQSLRYLLPGSLKKKFADSWFRRRSGGVGRIVTKLSLTLTPAQCAGWGRKNSLEMAVWDMVLQGRAPAFNQQQEVE